MTWGEFKAMVEKAGVQDSDKVNISDVFERFRPDDLQFCRSYDPEKPEDGSAVIFRDPDAR